MFALGFFVTASPLLYIRVKWFLRFVVYFPLLNAWLSFMSKCHNEPCLAVVDKAKYKKNPLWQYIYNLHNLKSLKLLSPILYSAFTDSLLRIAKFHHLYQIFRSVIYRPLLSFAYKSQWPWNSLTTQTWLIILFDC